MNNITKIMIAIGASIATGAVLGILFAPDEGSETRRRIVKRSKKLSGAVSDGINDGKESLEEVKEILQKELHKVNRKIEEIKF